MIPFLLVSFSAADQLLKLFGIAGALHRNLRRCHFQSMEIIRRELHIDSSDVLLQAVQFRRSWNGNDPRLLRECHASAIWAGVAFFCLANSPIRSTRA